MTDLDPGFRRGDDFLRSRQVYLTSKNHVFQALSERISTAEFVVITILILSSM